HADAFFVRNQRYTAGKIILDRHGKILITGKAGQGKTYLAYQLLLECLEDKNNVKPLIISTADEWKKLADSSTELAIVVDDMCGKYGLLQGEIKKWNENARFITALIDNRKHTVIFTMRNHIYEETGQCLQLESEISDPLFCKDITLKLESDSMNLNEEDKVEFALKYLKKMDLNEDEVLQVCRINESSIGFPLLCRTAQSIGDKSKLFDYFTKPLEIILRELERLRMEKSIFYGCLVLAMLSGGTLKLESINVESMTSDREEDIKMICSSYSGLDVKLADIHQAANALCSTYLLFSKSDQSYSFIHNAIEEAVFLSYGKLQLTKTLKLCSLQSLCKLCRINNESPDSNAIAPALMLDLMPIHQDILIERFVRALETKLPSEFANIAEANVWSSEHFRNLFMYKCTTIHVLADTDQNSLLVHAANANNCDLANELLRGMKTLCAEYRIQAVSFLQKAATASSVHRDLCLFRQLMQTGDVNGNDIISLTVEKGSEEAVKFLLQNGADIKYRSENGRSLLHIACLHAKLHMVKLLQSQYPLLVNQCDSRGRSVCHYAASGGNVEILNFLVHKGADPMRKDINGINLLSYACVEGKKEMAFHLLDTFPDMLYSVENGRNVIPMCAAFGGSIDILKRVFKLLNVENRTDGNSHPEKKETNQQQQADQEDRLETGVILLQTADMGGQLEMIKYLAEIYPDMIHDYPKYNVSIYCNSKLTNYISNVSILQYLIDQGMDAWCRTATQETFLHRSCLACCLERTKFFVEKYPNMINAVDNCNATPAHYAAFGGNVSVLQYLIDKGLDPWCRTATQETLLHRSCHAGSLEMTMLLVDKYPDMINEVDNCKGTPSHYAASGGNVSVLQYLIDKGVDPWCRTATQETLLHRSCLAGRLEITKYLVEKYPDMTNEVDNCKATPAHDAASGGNVSVVQYLIDKGVDPWCRTDTQETLLHRACLAGSLEITKYLVEKYPDMINEVDNCKRTPAHAAAGGGNVSVLQYLIDHGFDPWCRTATQETLVHSSCLAGSLEITKYLVGKYPDMIRGVDNNKRTPAHYAVERGNVSVVQYLIDNGVDPCCKTATQETLLHRSCLACILEITQYLVGKYPDMINEVDNCNATPAHYAAYGGNVSILQYLIDKGIDPWCRTAKQETLLHRACYAGRLEMTTFLVGKYPDMINEVDICKATPSHCASFGGNVNVLQYFIDQGMDPWCRTDTQETLLHRACHGGSLEITKYLVEKYPDMINEVDNCKRTPAHAAAGGGNVSVLQYLIDQGLNPWCRTATQETLVHSSCLAGSLEITKYLVGKYPDMINKVDSYKRTPAHYAVERGNVSVVQYLIDNGVDPCCKTATQETLLHRSCLAGILEITQYLVGKYPNMINEVDNCKATPAHYAASGGNVSVLQYLIDKGIDPWCRTATQQTLLHLSCLAGSLEITEFLVEKYPDMINQVDNCKGTAAHDAADRGNIAVLQYLIDKGVDPWCRTATQETLLHSSCLQGQLEMSKYLVEKYPEMINEGDCCKRTPGYCAADSSNFSILEYLIDHGLDPLCKTSDQQSLLHVSCGKGLLEMTRYLVESYPKIIYQVDNYKRTAAHYAAGSGNVSLLHYLIDQGMDPWCRTAQRETLLHVSCLNGRLEMTQFLNSAYPDMIKKLDICGNTPVDYAAHSSNKSVLLFLLDQGYFYDQ
ncbi:hypothetical protein ACJMK2_007833, partial [Sinanodonta woodiana]